MSMATIDQVTVAVLTRVVGLGLSLPSGVVAVAKGKQPKQEAGASAYTQIMVHPGRHPHDWRRFTNLHDMHTYRIGVTCWTPGNQDNTYNSDAYGTLHQALFTALDQKPPDLMGLVGLRDVRAETTAYVDRGSFNKNWDVQAVEVTIEIVGGR